MSGRFGSHFRTVFLASLLQELSFSLMLHFPGYAEELGANAVIGVRYDATEVMDGVTEVLCYGTAVVVERRT